MNKAEIQLWGRSLSLNVVLQYFPGEDILPEQEKAFDDFMKHDLEAEVSLEKVKNYILKEQSDKNHLTEIDNIFKYVAPKSLFVTRETKPVVAILCNYKFDSEHGMVLVFSDGNLTKVGTQDLIL